MLRGPAPLREKFFSWGWNRPLPLLAEKSAHFFRWLLQYEVWALRQWGLTARREQHRDFVKLRSRRWWLPPDLSLNWLAAYTKDPALVPRAKSYLPKK